MSRSEAGKNKQIQYINQYKKDNLKRIPLEVSKEKYEQIKTASIACGETVNGYIKKAIDDRLNSCDS